jgi:hypothetical protein
MWESSAPTTIRCAGWYRRTIWLVPKGTELNYSNWGQVKWLAEFDDAVEARLSSAKLELGHGQMFCSSNRV